MSDQLVGGAAGVIGVLMNIDDRLGWRALLCRERDSSRGSEKLTTGEHLYENISSLTRLFCIFALVSVPAVATSSTIDEAVQKLYGFQFTESRQALDRAVAEDPKSPLPYAFRAATYLFEELDRMGTLEAEFFSGDEWAYDKKKLSPDPQARASLQQALRDAESRADAALKVNPSDKTALFAMTIVQGVTADYMALVDKRQFGSLTPSKKSNNYAQQLLKLDPKFYDAYLTAGFSEYVVGSLPFFVRWFVKWDGVAGSKEKGRQNLELASREGHYFRSFAKILLAICAMREKRPRDAQKIMADLTREYPENPLYRRELDKLNGKLGAQGN
jgi:hypothetical protein